MVKDDALNQIASRLSKDMVSFKTFDDYKKYLIDRLNEKEPGEHTFEGLYQPFSYIDKSLQILPLEKIDSAGFYADLLKKKVVDLGKKVEELKTPSSYQGVRLGRQVDLPIYVETDPNGKFYVMDGMRRLVQTAVSDEKDILSFVDKGNGPTLEEVFNKVKERKQQ